MRQLVHLSLLAAGLGLIAAMMFYVGVDETINNFRNVSPLLLLPATLLYSLSWFFRALRLKSFLHMLGFEATFRDSLAVELSGNFANLVAPAKLGDVVKVIFFKREFDMPLGLGAVTALIIRLMDLAAVLVLILVSVVFLSRETATEFRTAILICGALVSCLLAGLVVVTFFPGLLRPLLRGPLRRVAPLLRGIHRSVAGNPGEIGWVFGQSLLVWVFDSWVLKLFLDSFSIQLSFQTIVFVLVMANLVKTLPVTPGAVGVLEGAIVGLLAVFGVPESVALSAAILDHGFKNLYTVVGGAVFLKRLGLSMSRLTHSDAREGLPEVADRFNVGLDTELRIYGRRGPRRAPQSGVTSPGLEQPTKDRRRSRPGQREV